MKRINYLSVCSGVEAATVAWHGLGWSPAAFSEIDAFPSAVLAHHYPSVPNLGDMSKFKEWPDDRAVDLLVGGTPCQSFSVAGLRKGLDDPRGNLMLTYLAIAERYAPRWIVWENVPGVLSSNRGRDFGTFLGALAQLGYGFAYRVLDAQFFGTPQRRRRVFVVGHLGSWQRAGAVLFERESLFGHTPPSRASREEIAGTVTTRAGSGGGGGLGTDEACSGFLQPTTAGPLTAGMGKGPRGTEAVESNHLVASHKWPADVASTLNAHYGSKHGLEDQHINGGAPLFVPFPAEMSGTQRAAPSDVSPALSVKHTTAVAFAQNTRDEVRYIGGDGKIVGALAASSGMKQTNYLQQNLQVRRLTPIECERLQGFPDNYTQIPYRNKSADKCPDGPRYKAMGNSMAVPVMRWIGRRINFIDQISDLKLEPKHDL